MARPGRKAKAVQRYPSGQPVHSSRDPRGETVVSILATVRAQREKLLPPKLAMRDEAGYELGRLYLLGRLNPTGPEESWIYTGVQLHRAGFEYMRLVHDHRCLLGFPSPFPKAMDFGAVHGLSLHSEPDPDRVRRISNLEMRSRTVLADAGMGVAREVRDVCIEDKPVRSVDNLKIGLQALAKLFVIPVDTQAR